MTAKKAMQSPDDTTVSFESEMEIQDKIDGISDRKARKTTIVMYFLLKL